MQKYTVIRKDWGPARYRGVVALVSRQYDAVIINLAAEFNVLEVLCFDVICHGCKIRTFVVYRPPYYDAKAQHYMDLLIKCLTEYINVKYANITVGDFNCPKVNWVGYTSCNDYIHSKLINLVSTSGLCQFVHFPTRGDNLLDLILSTDNQILNTVSPMPPLGHSDHIMDNQILNTVSPMPPLGHSDHIMVQFTLELQCYETPRHLPDRSESTYVWRKADYEGIANYLNNIDWYHLVYCCNPSAECAWKAFVAVVWNAVDLYVPKRTSVTNRCRKHHPTDIRKSITKKKRLGESTAEIRLILIAVSDTETA